MRNLKDRRFVAFDSVMVDVNGIEALAYQLQQRQGQDANGNPQAINVQVAVLMLDSGSSVTIGDTSLQKFEQWWKENVESEKVEIRGDTYEMIYAHMESQSKLSVGQVIQKGDFIGLADSTGNSTGSHLHFTLKKRGAKAAGKTDYKNDIIDPTNYFEELRD